ncbi:MAG: DNA mismatch repair endonuclease MutL [Dorea sp.]|nr:DNA mismatch repair endonuclease MutL [Dorea sp.]
MGKIQVLDQITIDKIAAGEVIERPASIVKELAENAIDAGATAVAIEIKEGGISLIRITDNGCGIEKEDVRSAFLRHSTSKIRSVEDLTGIQSLGFRGEALSSIAAVSQVELITKPREVSYGITYRIEGGKEISMDETGAPDGTTFLIRQLFYNTPARRKFLKTAMTEASHVADLVTRIALSHPEVSFQFLNNGQSKIHTSGNGNKKDIIYHIYGRDIASHLLRVEAEDENLSLTGYIGEPVVSRGNRNFENYFINGRYIKSNIIAKAIEDAYKDFTMQHKYPFTALYLTVKGELLDVNVHPSKMEVRFGSQQAIYNFIYDAVGKSLHQKELIPHVEAPEPREVKKEAAGTVPGVVGTAGNQKKQSALWNDKKRQENPLYNKQSTLCIENEHQKNTETSENRVFPTNSDTKQSALHKKDLDYFMGKMRERVAAYHSEKGAPGEMEVSVRSRTSQAGQVKEEVVSYRGQAKLHQAKQLDLFEERLLDKKSVKEHQMIGQVFNTYWLVEFQENLYIIDQHAAHERVLYEKTLEGLKTREYTSQNISPPIILELSMKEAELLISHMDSFARIGFEIENFGPDSYAVCAVPDNLFGIAKKELLTEMIDSLSDEIYTGLTPDMIDEKIASMSCKAAVKGKMRLSAAEADALIGELLELENPYHCPHGRPTIISMTKRELEKKFKRIV